MHKILGVRFREVGKIHYFKYLEDDIAAGDRVIAETKQGVECGKVTIAKPFPANMVTNPNEKIIRKATKEDLKSLENKKAEEKAAEEIYKKKIEEHKLKMKLIGVEYMFNRSKIIFYFVSESRIDFRNLVKELAYIFKVRIELRQVGIRDEAKMLGGLGMCGKPFCCSTFLNDFQPVSIRMAKDQGLSLNPIKLSGACGRLMCCLKYEQETYLDLIEKMPKIGTIVNTPDGMGVVSSQNVISGEVKVAFNNDGEVNSIKLFKCSDVKVVNKA